MGELALVIENDYYRIYSRATRGGGAYIKSSTVQSKSTKAGGGVVKSTSAGGGTTATSSSGGGVAKSTAAGGGSTQTTSDKTFAALQLESDFSHNWNLQELHTHRVWIPGSAFEHSHTVQIPSHTHSFEISNHSHTVSIAPHTHEINLSPHSHDFEVEIPAINIPEHVHEIEHGIYKLDRLPSKVTIKVDGNVIPHTALSGDSIDLIPYLALDSDNKVTRGWHTVEITPNDLARINAQLMVQFFMQSRGGVDA